MQAVTGDEGTPDQCKMGAVQSGITINEEEAFTFGSCFGHGQKITSFLLLSQTELNRNIDSPRK